MSKLMSPISNGTACVVIVCVSASDSLSLEGPGTASGSVAASAG